jgi:PAS domain S-box-containing protein
MRRILETTRLAIMVFDSTGNCVCASQAAMSLFGASEIQELRPLGSAGVSPPLQPDGTHSAEKWQQTLEQVRRQGSLALEWELLRCDGAPLIARVNLTHTQEDELLHCSIDDISDLKQALSRLEFLVHHDPLTSLPNRYSALKQLNQLLYQQDKPVGTGVISLKLRRFREFNDAYGHSMGYSSK